MMPSPTSRSKLKPSIWQFEAIGTHWSIETNETLDATLKSAIAERVEEFDKIYSRFRDDSVVAEMTKQAGVFELSRESDEMAKLYRKLYDVTDGAMTPLIGDVLVAAGYDKDYSFKPQAIAPAPVWDGVLHWSGSSVTTTRPVTFDIGAAGKGCLVDSIGRELESANISVYVIDASGDICHRGNDIQQIGLENPYDPSTVIGTMQLRNASLCASATNRRRWGNGWHHVLDARTGKPVQDVVATWAVAETTMLADGLATALFFVNGDSLRPIADFQFVRLFADGHIEHSKDFMGQLYI